MAWLTPQSKPRGLAVLLRNVRKVRSQVFFMSRLWELLTTGADDYSETMPHCRASPPAARRNGDPPALDLAELRVGHIDHQGQARCPHTHLQLGAQEAICEVEHHADASSCLLPVDVHVVAAL